MDLSLCPSICLLVSKPFQVGSVMSMSLCLQISALRYADQRTVFETFGKRILDSDLAPGPESALCVEGKRGLMNINISQLHWESFCKARPGKASIVVFLPTAEIPALAECFRKSEFLQVQWHQQAPPSTFHIEGKLVLGRAILWLAMAPTRNDCSLFLHAIFQNIVTCNHAHLIEGHCADLLRRDFQENISKALSLDMLLK